MKKLPSDRRTATSARQNCRRGRDANDLSGRRWDFGALCWEAREDKGTVSNEATAHFAPRI